MVEHEEGVMHDVLEELDKERTKRAELEVKLREMAEELQVLKAQAAENMDKPPSHGTQPQFFEPAEELLTGDLFDSISPFLTLQCVLRLEQVSRSLLTRVSTNNYECLKHLSHAYTVGHPQCDSLNHKQVLSRLVVCLPNALANQQRSPVYPYHVPVNFVRRRSLEHFPSTLQFSVVLWFRTPYYQMPYAGLLSHAFQDQGHPPWAGFKVGLPFRTKARFDVSQHSSYYSSSTVDAGHDLWDNQWHFLACVCDGTHIRTSLDAMSTPRPGVTTSDLRGVQRVKEYGRLQVPQSPYILGRDVWQSGDGRDRTFSGEMREVRLVDFALSDAAVQALCKRGPPDTLC
jgi:hypothetical protein